MKKRLIILFINIVILFAFIPIEVNAESTPSVNEEIIYDVIVDRFSNGNQKLTQKVDLNDPLTYQGGDIIGVKKNLDYIAQHGFTTISLSSIFTNAPKGYHGYWIEDFYTIEEQFGALDDLKDLIEEAHKRDIKVMLELVTNYAATTHPFVNDTDKQDWFKQQDIQPIEGTYWLENVIVFDQTHEDVQQYLIDVAEHWMEEVDIDGYQLHAADQMDDEFLSKLTGAIKEKNPNFMIIARTLQGNEDVDALLNNPHIDAVENTRLMEKLNDVLIQPDQAVSGLEELLFHTHPEKNMLTVDNKYTPRFSNQFAEQGRNAVTTWSLALAYLYLMPGTPVIYQGSEVPMYGPGFPENQYLTDFTSADPDLEDVFYRMGTLRSEFSALSHGDLELVADSEGLSLFKRTYNDESIYVAINNDNQLRVVTISDLESDKQLRGLFHDDTIRANKEGEFLIGMERESAEIFVIQPNVGFNWPFIIFVAGIFIVFVAVIIGLSRKQKQREL